MKADKPVHDAELDQELSQLFDATADQPSGPTLTKLSARATDIPAHVKRRPRWRSLLFWAPGMAAAVAALVLVLSPSLRHSGLAPSATHAALSAPVPEKIAKATKAPAPAPTPAATEDPDTSDLAAVFDDSDSATTAALSLDPLYGPSQDDNLDAWLYATSAVLKTGG